VKESDDDGDVGVEGRVVVVERRRGRKEREERLAFSVGGHGSSTFSFVPSAPHSKGRGGCSNIPKFVPAMLVYPLKGTSAVVERES